jgi:hypothetical protein
MIIPSRQTIKKIILTTLTAPVPTYNQANLSVLTLQLPADVKKEVQAKKGVTKLLLLHVCSDIENNFTSILDIELAKPSTRMEILLSTTRAACPVAYSDNPRDLHYCQGVHVSQSQV